MKSHLAQFFESVYDILIEAGASQIYKEDFIEAHAYSETQCLKWQIVGVWDDKAIYYAGLNQVCCENILDDSKKIAIVNSKLQTLSQNESL